ncbi:MAG: 4Fe-4S dicluster domain-containing protein, partial [Chloroflexi bacterium]|nr:4Fe-4S dicluster domain-containing protein [Chloroflexota bacterium]
EITNMMYATHGDPISTCIQCGTCSGTCPVVEFMDHTPRDLIGMIRADLKDEVLASNTYWYCASCFHCNVRCPAHIDIADLMYTLKRYSIWKNQYQDGLIGPTFTETFVKMILSGGRSYEPVLAPAYIFNYGLQGFLNEALTATSLILKGRIPVLPPRIKRLENFRRMVGHIIPVSNLVGEAE